MQTNMNKVKPETIEKLKPMIVSFAEVIGSEEVNTVLNCLRYATIQTDNQHLKDEILTMEEACKYLKVTRPHMYNCIKRGGLKRVSAGGKCVRFRKSELDRFIG